MKEILEKFGKAINKSLDEMIEPPRGLAHPSANDFYTMAKAIKMYSDLKKDGLMNTDNLKKPIFSTTNITVDANRLSYKNAEKLKKEVSEEISRIMKAIHSNNPAKSVHTADIPTGK